MGYLEAVIDRIEDDYAILVFEDNQTLMVPAEKLPYGYNEGTVLHVTFISDKESTKKSEDLAKQILNDILKDAE